jgi:hypothetical protein
MTGGRAYTPSKKNHINHINQSSDNSGASITGHCPALLISPFQGLAFVAQNAAELGAANRKIILRNMIYHPKICSRFSYTKNNAYFCANKNLPLWIFVRK